MSKSGVLMYSTCNGPKLCLHIRNMSVSIHTVLHEYAHNKFVTIFLSNLVSTKITIHSQENMVV